jgi:hypothetical protein
VISAVYSGDQNFATSTSTSLSQTINEPSTTTLTTTPAITSTTNSTVVPGPVALAVRSAVTTSMATVSLEKRGKIVKKVAAPKKVHPKGGSSTKFHQTKHAAVLKRSVALIAKHVKVKVKKK